MMIDECEASSRAADESRNVEGAFTSDQADHDHGNLDERDLFLEALLEPNEHAQRLLEIRTRVAELCRVSDILNGVQIPFGDILQSVITSFNLLRVAGFMQDSLILLADDPERTGVVQAVEIDVHEIELLESGIRTCSELLPGTVLHDKMYQAAQKLLGVLGLTDQCIDPVDPLDWAVGPHKQIETLGAILALATVSYAGSHCHDLGGDLLMSEFDEPARRHISDKLAIRSCQFACLDQYIGGPVWVFGLDSGWRGMILSITKEQFDDLWGPVIALVDPSSSQTMAFQTEGGFLSKAIPSRSRTPPRAPSPGKQNIYGSLSIIGVQPDNHLLSGPRAPLARENETQMHWTPAQQGYRSLPPGIRLDSFIDLNSTMLIGLGGQEAGPSSYEEGRVVPNCFRTNQYCKLHARSHQRVLEGYRLEYVGTSARQWTVDTKAVNLAVGWSGSSMGTNRTWKLRPATTWKDVMLLCCARPGRDIMPLMRKRVGLERSICTGNARRVSLFDALMSAFPGEKEIITGLLGSDKRDESSR
jgi:hypothetical protein